jgi:Ca2+-transporting ATPase
MQWHAIDIDETLKNLGVDASDGLDRREAEQRLSRYGPNELEAETGPSVFGIIFGQFKDVLIVILLIGTGLSALVGEIFNAGLILLIVLFSAGLGFIQEYRAEKAIDALKKMLSPTVTVLRDGNEVEVPSRELVPGDVLLLEAGDRVPADARMIDSHALKVDEAALTGESIPVEKKVQVVPAEARVWERHNMLFMGTAVVYGRGRAAVICTGMKTEFGEIARHVGAARDEKSLLERRTNEIGKWLGGISLAVCIAAAGAGVARQALTGDLSLEFAIMMIMFAVSLAVAAVPEALAGIVTGTLAIGMRQMAKRNALVRRMPAVETLGSVTVICSDKTGTITKGEMTVRRIYADRAFAEVGGVGYEPLGEFSPASARADLAVLHKAALLCNDAVLSRHQGRWFVRGDPTEGALVVLAAKAGMKVRDVRLSLPRIDEIPFSSERKRMTTIHRDADGARLAFMKGAVETVLERCSSEMRGGAPADLDERRRKAILDVADEMAEHGLRVLALATRQADDSTREVESEMALLGLVGMIDPARQESIEAVNVCRRIGVRPVMITGDHRLTAEAVAKEVGIYREGDKSLTGAALEALSDEEFERIVDKVSVYARVSPADKLRIIRAWKKRAEVVAMTGDGVNDAPALKHADVGVAMGITGTDVAKEAADIVLADDNFATILKAIEMGRWVYDNIRKYLTYLLRANIVEVVVLGGVVVVKGPEYLPLLPAGILFINVITDGLPAIALGLAPPEPDVMRRPPRDPRESVISLEMGAFVLLSLLITPVFFWVFFRSEDLTAARTDIFFLFVLVELAMALNLRSLRYSILQAPPHAWLVASVIVSSAVTFLVVALPPVRAAFGVTLPSLENIEIVMAVVLVVTAVSELIKIVLRKRTGAWHQDM